MENGYVRFNGTSFTENLDLMLCAAVDRHSITAIPLYQTISGRNPN